MSHAYRADTITIEIIAAVKKAAKRAKDELPGLSHTQRLDVLSARLCGVRNYHELLQRHKRDSRNSGSVGFSRTAEQG